MNLVEELQSLDVNDVGRWPLPFRIAVIAHRLRRRSGARYLLVLYRQGQMPRSSSASRPKSRSCARPSRTSSARRPTTMPTRRSWRRSSSPFGTMLRQLPGETEIPSLIVDISQTGLAAGLQEKLFQPQSEIPRDFYAEKPIKIRPAGRLPRDRQLRQRYCRTAAYRDVARHHDHAGSTDNL